MKKVNMGILMACILIIGVCSLSYAEQQKWKNGDVWEHYIQDCYVHSNLYCKNTPHSTSTGYTSGGENYVCNRSGLTEPGKVAKAKSGTHMFYTDKAWYKRNN